ncbi:MAG: hypothetical protein Q7R66_18955 [Undibacterium sp.]|uniref:hypothetical protein n=1 Tax=Undibacterium sp. TaxID=1914977 RepID=UPI0027225D53|nr:hypothetical protein [Undibacterium sp.]MDO8654256.1 hypothetical protein [Undibacterium sp.]
MIFIDNDNRTVVWLGFVTFILSTLFVWQGLDFTDMGFWLTGYQQFYSHPETIWAVTWLSSFIGHWIGLALGGSVLSYKFGYVIVVTTSAVITFLLLGSQLGRSRMLAAMVLLTVFFTRGFGGNWIGYNELTSLFYLIGVVLLFFGLIDNRKILVVLAGVVLGANLFIRLPNLVGIVLVCAVWLYAWSCRWSWRNILAWTFAFIGGFILGAALIWALILMHGHENIYLQSVKSILSEAESDSAPHAGGGLLKLLIRDHIRSFLEALIVLTLGGYFFNLIARKKTLVVYGLIIISVLLLTYISYGHGYWRTAFTGICYIVLLAVIFSKYREYKSLTLLAFMSVVVLFITPLGSTNGMSNAVFGMWLALPFTLIWLFGCSGTSLPFWFKTGDDRLDIKSKFSIDSSGYRILSKTIMITILLQSTIVAWRHTYLDSKNRFEMSTSIAHPLLIGTFTTTERAKVVTELIEAMAHFTKPDDEVLAYNGIPAVYFLTKTHPWLGISWPDFEGSGKIANLIRQKEQTGARLPCIVRATGSTYEKSWPKGAPPLATWWRQDEPRRVFDEFEKKHGYVVAWSNGFFEILIHPDASNHWEKGDATP